MWLPPNLKTSATAVFVLTSLVSSVSASCSSGGQADIVFVMDASGSVGAGGSGSVGTSNFATLKVFVQDLVNDFDIGSNTIRVGVEKYESKSYTEFNLNAYYVKSTMVSVIGNIYYSRGGTNTGSGSIPGSPGKRGMRLCHPFPNHFDFRSSILPSHCAGISSDIKAFYKASCLDLVVHSSWPAPMGNRRGDVLVYCERDTFCRITIDYVVEIVVEAFNGEMFAGIILSQNLTSNNAVDGLLGNADGDWLNEFYVPGPYSTTVYTSDYLSAYNKSAEAESAHTVTSGNTVLNHTDLSSVVTATAGWLIRGNGSVSVTYYNMNFTAKDEFTMEMWVYVDETVGQSYDLITFDTDLGVGVLGLDNGQLKLDWNKTYTSYMSVAITWRSSDGLMYFYTSPGGATALDMEWGFPYGSNLTISSLTFGGNAPYDVSFDYARVWSVVRGLDDFNAGLGTYDTQMHYGLEFLALFDDGTGSSAVASVVINDTVLYVQGAVTGGTWAVSDIPTADVYYPADLPAIVNQTEVVEACLTEFNTSLTEYCPSFGAIKQLLVELCISDYIRTNDPSMVKMAASAFAFYCQAVTQEKECYFKGYLDFCPDPVSSEDLLPLILGAVFGTLLCCSCSICLAGLIKKKLMDDAKPPEKKPEGPDGQKPDAEKPKGPEGEKDDDGFVEKNFSGGDLPPDAKPPVPPPSTNMYNYLNKMSEGVDSDNQDLFKQYNRSPSVNSIALSLQSYGIGSGATSPTLPTSPSTSSLGHIPEEPSDPSELGRRSSLRRPSHITPVNSPRNS
nr:hypothetical protein BaRGS_005399 [Batillaria attramentaria]